MNGISLVFGLRAVRWAAALVGLWTLGASAAPCWRAFALAPQLPALQGVGEAAGAGAGAGGAAEHYAPITSRNLFRAGATRSAPRASESAPPSQSGLRLLGTVYSDPSEGSLAVVRDPTEPRPRLVGVGASMSGAEVVEIERGALLLSRAGRVERLLLHDPLLAVAAPRAASAIRARPGPRGRRTVQPRPQLSEPDDAAPEDQAGAPAARDFDP